MTKEEKMEIADKILNPLTIIRAANLKNLDTKSWAEIEKQIDRIADFIKGINYEK